MPVGNPVTDLSTTGNFVPVTRTLTINGVSYDLSADRSWSIASPGGGSVTSVAMTVPTGFTVTGSPITTAGTLAVTFSAGYSLPTTVKQSNWDDAYTWVSNFPTQTGNAGKFLYTNGSVLSWQQALLNPFTVLGQIVYSGVSGSVEVLNGNTTTQRLYLQQVGTGTSSAAPSWGGIISTDITGQALTKTDDTNVTLTLGGTPGNSVLNAVSLTLGWAGTLAVSRGGSGAATLSGVLIGNGTSAFTAITGGPNQLLRVNGTATGFEFYSASFLTNPMTLNYDMIYQNAGIPARLPGNITTTKQYLTSIGNGSATTSLAWASFTNSDVPGDALTRVNDTNVTLTLGGTPSTAVLRATSITLGWAGQLAVSRGGTGAATLTGVLIGNGTSAVTTVVGAAGQYLRRNLANTAYEFRTLQGGDIAGSELTKTDDTNVTLSLGGTPASALLQPVSLTLGWSGQLSVSRGGTGASTLTGVVIGNGTSAMTAVSGTAGQLLRRNPANTAYEFFTASLISGNGVADRVAKWTSATNLVDSQIIDNGTNVGIGGSPSYKLDVQGNSGGITINTNGAVSSGTEFISGSGIFASNSSGTDVAIKAGATTLMTLASGGNVGIGVYPTYKLQIAPTTVYSALNTGDGFVIYNPSLSSVNLVLGVNGSGVSQGALIQGRSGTTSTFAIQLQPFGGNVGIGINPSYKLDVNGAIGLSNTILAFRTGGETLIYDESSVVTLRFGDSTNQFNNYENATHYFKNRGASVSFATINSSGLQINTGHLQLPSANYITWGGVYGTDIPTISGTSGGGTNGFLQFYPAGSTSGVKMALLRTGQLALPSYTTSTSFSGTAVATLAVTNAGDVITIAPSQTTASGTYTPTWTGLANVGSVTAFSCQYMRVGDTVTVSGWVTIDAVADNTPTSLSFSLPINSNTTSVNYLNGTGVQQGGGAAASLSGYASNYGEFEVSPLVDTAVNYSFHFTYRIV